MLSEIFPYCKSTVCELRVVSKNYGRPWSLATEPRGRRVRECGWRRKQRVIRKPFFGERSDQVALGAGSQPFTEAEEEEAWGGQWCHRLGAGLNHCECWCWCEVGDLSSSVLVWMINWQGRERWMAIDKAMSEWRHTLKCKLETAEKFKVLVLMSVKRASRFAKGCAIKLRQVVVERSLSEPKEWTGFC
jgi:hypothetical protein